MGDERSFVVIVDDDMSDERADEISEAIRNAVAPFISVTPDDEAERVFLLAADKKPPLAEIKLGKGGLLSSELREKFGLGGDHRTMGVVYIPPDGGKRR